MPKKKKAIKKTVKPNKPVVQAVEETEVPEVSLSEHVREAYGAYGTYVNLSRALVDIRDGVKPVNRRILWAMHKMNISGFVKCARAVGTTMGVYHPHGDASIYDALVKMTFTRYPFVVGQGNFGSAVNSDDKPAAARYTECRLSPLAKFLFECEKVGEYQPNYDDRDVEPSALASRFPILLANGTSGIGFGIAAGIPPHNLGAVLDLLSYVVDHPNADDTDIVGIIGGPDYTTGGVLTSSKEEIESLYTNGTGSLTYRCKYHFEEGDKYGQLIITEVAPEFDIARFSRQCAKWMEEGVIAEANDRCDGKNPVRFAVAFHSLTQLEQKVIPALHTRVSYNFNLTKKDRVEERWSLLRIARTWISYRKFIETKELNRQKDELTEKLQKELAKKIAAENLSLLFKILETEKTEDSAIQQMVKKLKLTEFQAKYLLGISVRSIANFQLKSVKDAIKSLKEEIVETERWLKNINKWLKHQFERLRPFADERRTVRGPMKVEAPALDTNARWIASDGGCNLKGWKNPPLSVQWEFDKGALVSSTDKIVAVTQDGTVQFLSAGISSREFKSQVVGLAPTHLPYLFLVDEASNVLLIDMEQKRDKLLGMKTNKPLVAAYGVDKTSQVVFVPHNGDDFKVKLVKDLPVKRAGSAPYRLAGKTKGSVIVLGPNVVYHSREDGSKVKLEGLAEAFSRSTAVAVGDRNFVSFYKTKARKMLTRNEVLLLDLEQVERCIPIF